jgi:amino acid transporter
MEDKSSPMNSYPAEPKGPGVGHGENDLPVYPHDDGESEGLVLENVDDLKRRLSGRQIQMVTIGGSIGTALFVSIGSGLTQGGPGSLFIAFILYSCFLGLVNNCMAEMSVFMPVSGSFVRMGSKWVDEAFGFMLGWNFFLYGQCDSIADEEVESMGIDANEDLHIEAVLIPWEISALNLVLTFWRYVS